MMATRTIAPAKINWTLEVLRRRGDGYHEVRSVMQTIDLHDDVRTEPAGSLTLHIEGPHTASDDDHTLAAARLLGEAAGRAPATAIAVRKRIPVGAGLGGGSSDAAAVLRALDRMWGLDIETERLARMAAAIGSDAPFFVYGGTALAEGRGERVTPLPEIARKWLLLVVPPLVLPNKTRRMYHALRPRDFSDGSHTRALADHIRGGKAPDDDDLYNAFEGAALESFAGLASYRESLLRAGARRVHLAGSGPALFAVFASEDSVREVAARLEAADASVLVASTLAAGEATAVEG